MTSGDDQLYDPRTAGIVLRAYAQFYELLETMPAGYVEVLAASYRKGHRDRRYSQAADRAADLAYETGLVDDKDQVIGVDVTIADLTVIGADAGDPLGGYALDLALAVIAAPELDPDDWEIITKWWRDSDAPLPIALAELGEAQELEEAYEDTAEYRRATQPPPFRPAEIEQAPRPVPVRPAPRPGAVQQVPRPRQAITAEVANAHIGRMQRVRHARRLRRRATALWLAEAPLGMVSAAWSGWAMSPVPLLVGFLLIIAVGVFAATTSAKAGRA